MSFSVKCALFSLSVFCLYSQTCPYETIAGPARTFLGDGIDAKSARLSGPSQPVVASDGTLYFADTWNHRIRRVDPAGIIHTAAGTGERAFKGDNGSALQAAFNEPIGLALASDGSLYISDTANNRVRKLSPKGVITTVAGNGHNRFSGDGGPGSQAALNRPTVLALDSKGNLYILDSGNWRVRMLTPDGTISTVAGSGGDEDYGYTQPTFRRNPTPQPAVQARISGLHNIAVDRNSVLYLALDQLIAQVGTDGILSPLTATTGGIDTVTDPTPVGNIQAGGLVAALRSGALLLTNGLQLLSVENGTARPIPSACAGCVVAEDLLC